MSKKSWSEWINVYKELYCFGQNRPSVTVYTIKKVVKTWFSSYEQDVECYFSYEKAEVNLAWFKINDKKHKYYIKETDVYI